MPNLRAVMIQNSEMAHTLIRFGRHALNPLQDQPPAFNPNKETVAEMEERTKWCDHYWDDSHHNAGESAFKAIIGRNPGKGRRCERCKLRQLYPPENQGYPKRWITWPHSLSGSELLSSLSQPSSAPARSTTTGIEQSRRSRQPSNNLPKVRPTPRVRPTTSSAASNTTVNSDPWDHVQEAEQDFWDSNMEDVEFPDNNEYNDL